MNVHSMTSASSRAFSNMADDMNCQTIIYETVINVNLCGSCFVTEERLHECEEDFCKLLLLHILLFKHIN